MIEIKAEHYSYAYDNDHNFLGIIFDCPSCGNSLFMPVGAISVEGKAWRSLYCRWGNCTFHDMPAFQSYKQPPGASLLV